MSRGCYRGWVVFVENVASWRRLTRFYFSLVTMRCGLAVSVPKRPFDGGEDRVSPREERCRNIFSPNHAEGVPNSQ